jgi:hypothetical protein
VCHLRFQFNHRSHVFSFRVEVSSTGQRTLDKVEAVLAPKNLAIDHIAGGTKHARINGRWV